MENQNFLNLNSGMLERVDNVQIRKASDLKGFFSDEKALESLINKGDPVIYKVFEQSNKGESAVSYAVTLIYPGTVGKEYFMTKGHFHKKSVPELYLGLKGSGLLVTEDRTGNSKILNMHRGSVLYVDPDFAHRSINTGNQELVFLAIYSSDAGHDYESIKNKGFSVIVVNDNGSKIVKNPRFTQK